MEKITKLLKKLNIKTKNVDYYFKALTHSSYANEHNIESNERLEFLGDAVLDLLMGEFLFKHMPHEREGKLTKVRAQRVCEEALFTYAKHINLGNYIKLGKGELQKGPTESIVADAFEALLGTIYLDKGLPYTRKFFNEHVLKYINETKMFLDYKTKIQEVFANIKHIEYKLKKTMGPAHNRTFVTNCIIDGDIVSEGFGKTKKDSEQNAARLALSKFDGGEKNNDFKKVI